MRKSNSGNNGITLIALVITILVLLILAGVAISTLTGENGIIARAKSAKEENEKAEKYENTIMNEYEQYINKYVVSDSGDSSELTTENIKQIKEEIKRELKSDIFNETYPVGSVYISTNLSTAEEVSNKLGGGKWAAYAGGRTLIADGTNDGYTFTAGSTGTTVGATTNPLGEYTHRLTVAELAKHSHDIYVRSGYSGSRQIQLLNPNSTDKDGEKYGISDYLKGDSQDGLLYAAETGENTSHNNIQPYLVCYMWQRIE